MALLFVHGAGSDHSVWNNQLQGLDIDVALAALNLSGHGNSQQRESIDINIYCDDVMDVLVELNCPTVLIGQSLGGAVTMHVALQQPKNLIGLGLISTGARLKVLETLLALIETDFDGAVDFLIGLLFHQSIPEVVQQTRQRMLQHGQTITLKDFEVCNNFDIRNQLEKIDIPTWICVGEQDQMTPVKFSEYLLNAIQNATLDIVPEAGHMVMLEQPTAFNLKLIEWLKATFSLDQPSVEG